MKTRAAVAFAAKQPLEIVEVDLEGPKQGEVLVEIMATGICHTDAYTLDGFDSEGIFPSILGHEGAGVVREIGPDVTSVKSGDHVIPLYTPECRQCKSCLSGKTNLCTAIRATQGKGVMPDGTSRFSYNGETIFHYMGCSTFSNFTVLPEIAVAVAESRLDVRRDHRRSEEVVGRDVEKALDLPGVQIDRKDPVCAGSGNEVGNQLGRDRST